MNAREIEERWSHRCKQVGGLVLFSASDAVALLDDCIGSDVRLLGVEAFRIFDEGGIQPAMEFSNISFGRFPMRPGDPELEFKRGLQEPWANNPAAVEQTKTLITSGAANGYTWYEVSLEDPETGDLLFFRDLES